MAPPGCPDLAFSTMDAARMRILSAALVKSAVLFIRWLENFAQRYGIFAKFAFMKRTFYTIIYVYLIVFGSILTGHAMPAYPKPIEVIQPDGTKLTILLKGDEYFHYAQSMDGYILKQNQKGFYTFATLDTEGLLQSSDVVARNIEDRKIEEADFLKTIKPGLSYSGTAHGIAIRKRMKNVLDGNSMLRSASA